MSSLPAIIKNNNQPIVSTIETAGKLATGPGGKVIATTIVSVGITPALLPLIAVSAGIGATAALIAYIAGQSNATNGSNGGGEGEDKIDLQKLNTLENTIKNLQTQQKKMEKNQKSHQTEMKKKMDDMIKKQEITQAQLTQSQRSTHELLTRIDNLIAPMEQMATIIQNPFIFSPTVIDILNQETSLESEASNHTNSDVSDTEDSQFGENSLLSLTSSNDSIQTDDFSSETGFTLGEYVMPDLNSTSSGHTNSPTLQ